MYTVYRVREDLLDPLVRRVVPDPWDPRVRKVPLDHVVCQEEVSDEGYV